MQSAFNMRNTSDFTILKADDIRTKNQVPEAPFGASSGPYFTLSKKFRVRWRCGFPSTSSGGPASTTTPPSMKTT